jgi:ABC-type glycerol-3-phosphate transport system substrate-binding protein
MSKNLIKSIVSILLISLFVFSGCSNRASEEYQKVKNNIDTAPEIQPSESKKQNEAEALAGTLTISTYYDAVIMKYAQEFMQFHPKVKIEMEAPDMGEWESENLEQYGVRTAIEIMSGKGADLIDLSNFSAYRYAGSDLLCNLYDFMDNDPDFNKADYYTNIFTAKEIDGSLYTMPFHFTYDMMVVSRPLTEGNSADYDALDYKSMLSIYESVLSLRPSPEPRILPGIVKEYFWRYEFPAYYDTNTGEAWFNSAEFVEYLKKTNTVQTPYDPINMDWDKTRIAGNDDFMESDYLFCGLDVTAIDVFNLLADYSNISTPISIVSSGGDAMFRTKQAEYGIPTSSVNKELAWEFLKFCVEEKTPPDSSDREKAQEYVMDYHTWIPINIKNFHHAFRLQCELDIDMFGDSVKWKEENPKNGVDEMLALVHGWNLQRNRAASETELWFLIHSDLENYYYYDLATAEETASMIQAKVSAYLGEQR